MKQQIQKGGFMKVEKLFCNKRYSIYEAGKDGVVEVEYHFPEGDTPYCYVKFDDGTEKYILDIDELVCKEEV